MLKNSNLKIIKLNLGFDFFFNMHWSYSWPTTISLARSTLVGSPNLMLWDNWRNQNEKVQNNVGQLLRTCLIIIKVPLVDCS
jgi:hypothetical protein